MTHVVFRHFSRPTSTIARHIGRALALVMVLLTFVTGSQAQEATSAHVPGELLLAWRADVATCARAEPTPALMNISPDVCQRLADLARSEPRPAESLAEQRHRPEWQAAAHSLAALTGLEVRDLLLPHGIARLGVPPGREAAEINRLNRLPWVEYAEPNYIAHAAATPADVRYPNDPFIGDQWNMRRIGAPQAWAVTQGSNAVIAAVLDSGVDLGHPEFIGRLMLGKNYLNPSLPPNDDYGHGTHVAGLIAANADNFTGISGLAPGVRLLPLKVLDNRGEGSYFNIAAAIRDATDLNARIINLSLGGYSPDQTLQSAVNYALNRGQLVVAAAGNCALGGQSCQGVNPTYYPAAYPGVLAVGASDRFDNWAPYSGYKPYVGLAAPGGIAADRILSTWRNGGYNHMAGTSMATPLVSAAAALVWTMQPAATAQQVTDILTNTADKVGAHPDTGQSIPYVNGRNDYFGYGRLNVANAVRWAHPPRLESVEGVQGFLTSDPIQSQTRTTLLENPSEQGIHWQAQVIQGAAWLDVLPSGGWTSYSNPGALTLRTRPVVLAPGIYDGVVRVQAVTPSSVQPIEIKVELRVATQLHRTHLPLVGRDWFGISWFDPFAADAPPPMALNLSNDTAYPVSLPFPVTFYGRSYTAAWVSDNGLVWFGQGSAASLLPPNACLPSAAAPNNAIYVLAQDWDPGLGGQIYAHQPNADVYVITWYQVRRPWNATPQSFQLIFQHSGEIAASYRTIEALPPAIIGTENDDGTVAAQIYCSGMGRRPVNGDTFLLQATLPWQ